MKRRLGITTLATAATIAGITTVATFGYQAVSGGIGSFAIACDAKTSATTTTVANEKKSDDSCCPPATTAQTQTVANEKADECSSAKKSCAKSATDVAASTKSDAAPSCSDASAKTVAASNKECCSKAGTSDASVKTVAASNKDCSKATTCDASAKTVAASNKSCSKASTRSSTGAASYVVYGASTPIVMPASFKSQCASKSSATKVSSCEPAACTDKVQAVNDAVVEKARNSKAVAYSVAMSGDRASKSASYDEKAEKAGTCDTAKVCTKSAKK